MIKIRILYFVVLVFSFMFSANAQDKTVTLHADKVRWQALFDTITAQTGYNFLFEGHPFTRSRVSIQVTNEPVKRALESIFRDQPITFKLINSMLVLLPKANDTASQTMVDSLVSIPIQGSLHNSLHEPIAAATIEADGVSTCSDANGRFTLYVKKREVTVAISHVQYETHRVRLLKGSFKTIELKEKSVKPMQEVISASYPFQMKSKQTGDISITNLNRTSQNVRYDIITSLGGSVTGVTAFRTGSNPFGLANMQVRGPAPWINQIGAKQLSSPLILIDGMPISTGNLSINQLSSFRGADDLNSLISILSFYHPKGFESIEILKDADATAIYGSRGANGVIILNSRKPKSTAPRLELDIVTGIAQTPQLINLLNTKGYLGMRHEALVNDGLSPNKLVSPDITIWDSSISKNYHKEFLHNPAGMINVFGSASGGGEHFGYRLNGSLHRESTTASGDLTNQIIIASASTFQMSKNKKFTINFSGTYSSGKMKNILPNISQAVLLSPNMPPMINSEGVLQWDNYIKNYKSYLLQRYKIDILNMLVNMRIDYKLNKHLSFKANAGINTVTVNEHAKIPIASQNPQLSTTGTAYFANNFFKSWHMEPMLEYKHQLWHTKFRYLLGLTYQNQTQRLDLIEGTGYVSDHLLWLQGAANSLSAWNEVDETKYLAFFGAINADLLDRYIINLTGRRDGSSKYGPSNRFQNFGAVGIAWLLSKEKWFKEFLNITDIKLRSSTGITGFDQSTASNFKTAWERVAVQRNYGNIPGFATTGHTNPNSEWEQCKKSQISTELTFSGRIPVTITYYVHRSSNQIINKILPMYTGYGSMYSNLNAVVKNTGWEVNIEKYPMASSKLKWQLAFTLTLPRNRLASFPGLAGSVYANRLIVGQPLNVQQGYDYLGVNSYNGLYAFADRDLNGTLDRKDYTIIGHVDPKLYGSLYNNLQWKNWQFDFFFEFQSKSAYNQYLHFAPGRLSESGLNNIPIAMLDRWRQSGDEARFQRFTANSAAANVSLNNARSSSFSLVPASYVRLRNISLSYLINGATSDEAKDPKKWFKAKIFIESENLFTLTPYKLADPTTQVIGQPLLRGFNAGVQLKII